MCSTGPVQFDTPRRMRIAVELKYKLASEAIHYEERVRESRLDEKLQPAVEVKCFQVSSIGGWHVSHRHSRARSPCTDPIF